ncbi:hypothetical protein GCM10010121_096600 [Streptomyces brasiliensis]|uniref:Uncharacterized protein n=1 Tax=Streptomyces brasiliensis TaxID=1954 RepID=A0A917UNU3_9ACTN|nr:hypothetical protein GCM10010121_096600 [Streptomyces brasiliensis]
MDAGGRVPGADAEFDESVRVGWALLPSVFLLGFPLLNGGDLAVDPLQPHGMPSTTVTSGPCSATAA